MLGRDIILHAIKKSTRETMAIVRMCVCSELECSASLRCAMLSFNWQLWTKVVIKLPGFEPGTSPVASCHANH